MTIRHPQKHVGAVQVENALNYGTLLPTTTTAINTIIEVGSFRTMAK